MTTVSFSVNLDSVKIGNAGEVSVDVTKFNSDVLQHIFGYGLKQMLNDCRSAEKESSAAMALVEKKLGALYEGKVRAGGERESDPIKAEAKKIATGKVNAALKAKGLKKEELPEGKYAELVKTLAARADTLEAAKANVERAKQLTVEDDILAGL